MNEEISSKPVQNFVFKSRHLKAFNILSCQQVKMCLPSMMRQADYYILFAGLQEDALDKIKKDGDLNIEANVLWDIYKKATSVKYSFLLIDVRNEIYRMNFDKKFNITV